APESPGLVFHLGKEGFSSSGCAVSFERRIARRRHWRERRISESTRSVVARFSETALGQRPAGRGFHDSLHFDSCDCSPPGNHSDAARTHRLARCADRDGRRDSAALSAKSEWLAAVESRLPYEPSLRQLHCP